MESERRGLERCGASLSLSLSERGSGRVSDRVLRIREAGRDFTGVRRSSERGKEGGGRREGGKRRWCNAGQDSFHTTHSDEHASFAGKPYSGEPQNDAVKCG